jgi:hypothetical protein
METKKRFSAAALHSLQEALYAIYWYKDGLRGFMQNAVPHRDVVATANWSNNKRQIIAEIVSRFTLNQDIYYTDLMALATEVARMENFDHLLQLEGGQIKAASAKSAVNNLRRLISSSELSATEKADVVKHRERMDKELAARSAAKSKLVEIRDTYTKLVTTTNPQTRGFSLEKVLRDLFEYFDLDPRASFKLQAEQIDGAFTSEGSDYLFEAKWQSQLVASPALDSFSAKVRRKLENTRGLFLSINGFSHDAVILHNSSQPVIMLMTGSDLMAILEERIGFPALLLRKRRHAAQTGEILLTFEQF